MSIEITTSAADQIQKSAIESELESLPLRIAATRKEDDSLHYALGFDDVGNNSDDDLQFESNGINIIVSKSSFELLDGTTLDYVELEPKQFHFVFLNPNDPNYSPPTEKK